jgi:hypothetical protein
MLANSNKRAQFLAAAGGTAHVDGALMALSSTGETELETDDNGSAPGGGDVTVDGLFSILGNSIDFRVGDSSFTVNGMAVVATYDSGSLQRFDVDRNGKLTFNFDDAKLQSAVDHLTDSLESTFHLPATAYGGYQLVSYVELLPADALAQQEAALSDPGKGVGLEDLSTLDTSQQEPSPPPTEAQAPPATDPPAQEPDPSQDPNWDPALGIVLDASPMQGKNEPCHCGALKANGQPYKYRDHHGKKFW